MNDNPPVFSQKSYSFSVAEATPVGMTVWQNVLENGVVDLDSNENGHLYFSILPGNGSEVKCQKTSDSGGTRTHNLRITSNH